jgi:hypothetical protein
VALILDTDWQWWLLAAGAFVYGTAILTMILVLVIKSGHTCFKRKSKASKFE